MDKLKPIGIFDSGIGGLTVVKTLIEKLPQESFIYFGDTAHLPYGDKTRDQLFGYAYSIIDFMRKKHVKAIIVACGTHSAVTLPSITEEYDFPILGVVKAGAKSAARLTRNGKIGVIATQATVNSLAYTKNIKEINCHLDIYEVACPRFVPLIEAGRLEGEETRKAVEEYISPLLRRNIDTLVLGCTHYPFLTPVIREFIGDKIILVDPAWETVEEMKDILKGQDLLSDSGILPEHKFYVSGDDSSFYEVGKRLIGDVIDRVERINLD
ncbi:glutamate racemase [Thermosyntropha sp.]|uniref:glutamate racemase n=1 Tax=Thermosyntropha sp. TaxID=2740820 RepID=UPI0025CC0D8A|nr:glutamate racemase [Thermosyntropha sp.]MBO8159844.1 glutamate racemase [Thermosyntropha sp.]